MASQEGRSFIRSRVTREVAHLSKALLQAPFAATCRLHPVSGWRSGQTVGVDQTRTNANNRQTHQTASDMAIQRHKRGQKLRLDTPAVVEAALSFPAAAELETGP